MASRREFICAGTLAVGAIAGGPVVYGAQARPAQSPRLSVPLYTVIFDARFEDSRRFGMQAQQRGLRTRNLDNGDVTRLWYDDLYHRWNEGPAPIAGLTTPSALFVLETFGNDAGLRLQFKAEHRRISNQVQHRLSGPDALLRKSLSLEGSGAGWGGRMGQIIGASTANSYDRREAEVVTPLAGSDSAPREMLVSWVLAPRASRAPASLTI